MTFAQWVASLGEDYFAGADPEFCAKVAWEAGYNASEEEFHAPLGNEPLPSVMLEALDITRDAVAAQVELNDALDDTEKLIREQAEAIALLRELNDIVWGVIPSDLQARMDAVLDLAEEK